MVKSKNIGKGVYGRGSVFKRSDGRWIAKFNGKQRSCASQTAAEKALREMKLMDTHTVLNIGKCTVRDVMDEWLYGIKQANLKPKSFDKLEWICKTQIYPYIGDMQFSNINSDDIEKHLLNMSTKYSRDTIKKTYEALNGCVKNLVRRKKIKTNPISEVEIPSRKKKALNDIIFYTPDELKVIYAEAKSTYKTGKMVYRLGYAIPLLGNTGLRIGELLGLRWSDVDFEKKLLYVKGNLVFIKNRNNKEDFRKYLPLLQPTPKTAASTRTVSLNKSAIEALNKLHDITGSSDYVIVTQAGNFVHPRNIDRMFRTILVKCGFEESKISGVHALRHSFASALFEKGAEIKKISKLLGHASVKITYDIYVHFIKEDLSDVTNLLDELDY